MLARNWDRLKAAAAEVAAAVPDADSVMCVGGDVGDPASVRNAVAQAAARFGGLDSVLNIAGTARIGEVAELTDEDIRSVVDTNYLGPLYVAREAIPYMRKAGRGDILNVSSEITLDNLPLMSIYSSSKAALEAQSRTLTQEVKGENIRVTLIVLGTVADTGFATNFSAADLERATPLWEADGYGTRVAGTGPPISADAVAEVFEFAITRPAGLMLDVLHVRAM
jgi:NADP-dependent 3-hydroxy acid dehydrogenase YdfG